MSIKVTLESTYAILTPDASETLDGILQFISDNIHLWNDKNTLWDVRALNFKDISPEKIRLFTDRIQPVTKIREGLKTAIVVNSDLSFGMTRMFQLQYNEKINIYTEIFKDKDEAVNWLTDDSTF